MITPVTDKCFGLSVVRRSELERDAKWKGENLKTVLNTFPGTSLRSRSVTEHSGGRISRYENV